ncbi:hypothetical protein JOF53_007759 [Crossiella equi]|uniref:Uncharacterized protein n=1 Tax=Crossiella equi TaxID=130796 RepID=A0ABS5AR52_9PSEU|nr:hypothetical protein [Crossiella equi]MBP2478887.1 hypothetical protein [Crossiella equi]
MVTTEGGRVSRRRIAGAPRLPAKVAGAEERRPHVLPEWWTRWEWRVAVIVLELVAALCRDEALVLVTRALIAMGDMIADAGKPERS